MEDNTKSVENKNNTLMNKTKVQLVDIILRKDARERELLNNIAYKDNINSNLVKDCNGMEEELNNLRNINNGLQDEINISNKELEAYKRDYQDICDKRITECFNYNKGIKIRDNLIRVFSLVTVIELLLLIYYILQ